MKPGPRANALLSILLLAPALACAPDPGDAGQDAAALTASWSAQLDAFRALRAPYLLYPE